MAHHFSLPIVQPARISLRYSTHSFSLSTRAQCDASPPSTTVECASVRTFALSDLLEQVLLETCDEHIDTPQLHLFLLQRVNTTFQQTIETSSLLQRRMLVRCDDLDAEELDWPSSIKWLSSIGLFPDLWIHSQKFFGPCLQFGTESTRVDSGLGFVDVDEDEDEPMDPLCFRCLRRKLDYRSASWRNMRLPTRWHGRELTYCLPLLSHRHTGIMFWLRSGRTEVTAGQLYDQLNAISDIGAETGIALASYCRNNVKREVLLCLRYFLPVAWPEHRDGICMQCPDCMYCRGQYWVDSLPLAVDWPLDGSRLSLPHKGTQVVLDYLGYAADKKHPYDH